MQNLSFFASCPLNLEYQLVDELLVLGADSAKPGRSGVYFTGDLKTAYQACLWSRLANRVLMPLHEFPCTNENELYEGVFQLDWSEHFDIGNSFAVHLNGKAQWINNSHFLTLRVKDAIVDKFQQLAGDRPSVEKSNPDVCVSVFIARDKAIVYLDLAGDSLHKRGYRKDTGEAPLKENLAAALLQKANWSELAKQGTSLVDPMCGSGTFLIEAVLMAADIAPGLYRKYFALEGWKQHQADVWLALIQEAEQRREKGLAGLSNKIIGFENSNRVIAAARENINRAGLTDYIRLKQVNWEQDRTELDKELIKNVPVGLLIANPPYGERLGIKESLVKLYQNLGLLLKKQFVGWQAAVITSEVELARAIGLHSYKQHKCFNGQLECKLYHFDVQEKHFIEAREQSQGRADDWVDKLKPGAAMFYNRLKKNQSKLKKWLKAESISCYRLYDADLPEYAVAIDVYEGVPHIQEYAAPKSVDKQKAQQRLKDVIWVCAGVFGLELDEVSVKTRQRQKGTSQYEKLAEEKRWMKVNELGCQYWVNLWDYLDTGVFLDHRPVRKLIQESVKDRRFLNLFCYTATATLNAIKGGASQTVSVDMSATYLKWAERNLQLNQMNADKHKLVRADCMEWLKHCEDSYEVIFIDPPTFSNSKRMEDDFDVQKDHAELIHVAMKLLVPKGVLIFSNNYRKFVLDEQVCNQYDCDNITESSIPKDFARRQNIHQCWLIKHKKKNM